MSDDDEPREDGEAWARGSDPDTSHDAADDARGERAIKMERQVYACLVARPNGLTNWEIVELSGLSYHSATPRVKPLRNKNLVYDSGEKRLSPYGKMCKVWRATIYRPEEPEPAPVTKPAGPPQLVLSL